MTATIHRNADGAHVWFYDGQLAITEPWDNDNEGCVSVALTAEEMRKVGRFLLELATQWEAQQ